MNSANLLRVADAIEKHEIKWLGFNMNSYVDDEEADFSGHGCGTTACIAGWCLALLEEPSSAEDLFELEDTGNAYGSAKEFLDLTDADAGALFYRFSFAQGDISSKQAARTLRYAAKHHVIDWDAAQAEGAV